MSAATISMNETLVRLKGGLIVSSQAAAGEPLNTPQILTAMAESALTGGAVGIRMAQADNLQAFRASRPEIPLIGLTKPEPMPDDALSQVYITPTFEALSSIALHCDIVALDATTRPRPNEETLPEIVGRAREKFPNLLLMADISTEAEGANAAELGFDLIGTTLSGYTAQSAFISEPSGPDFGLLSTLTALPAVRRNKIPVILEGRVWEPFDVTQAFCLGAHAVVVGSAVTRPHEITRRFRRAIPQ